MARGLQSAALPVVWKLRAVLVEWGLGNPCGHLVPGVQVEVEKSSEWVGGCWDMVSATSGWGVQREELYLAQRCLMEVYSETKKGREKRSVLAEWTDATTYLP